MATTLKIGYEYDKGDGIGFLKEYFERGKSRTYFIEGPSGTNPPTGTGSTGASVVIDTEVTIPAITSSGYATYKGVRYVDRDRSYMFTFIQSGGDKSTFMILEDKINSARIDWA